MFNPRNDILSVAQVEIEEMGCSGISCYVTVTGACWWLHCATRAQLAASPSNIAPSMMMNSHQYIQGTPMAPESIGITQSLFPHTFGSSNFPDGLLDDSVTGQCSTNRNELVEVRRRGRSCTQFL